MNAMRILHGLETIDATGVEAERLARQGFLQWALEVDAIATPEAARAALSELPDDTPASAAAQAFVGFLHQATHAMTRPVRSPRRRRGPSHLH